MARASQTSTVVKPSLPFKVTGNLLDGEYFEFPCSKGTAIKSARDFMRSGLQNITIWEHDGASWNINVEMLDKVKGTMQGTGNAKGVLALQQLSEHTNELVKMAGKAQKTDVSKAAFDAEIEAWLTQFGLTCKSLNVTPHAINNTLGAIYQPAEA
jgi:hypothetical protein